MKKDLYFLNTFNYVKIKGSFKWVLTTLTFLIIPLSLFVLLDLPKTVHFFRFWVYDGGRLSILSTFFSGSRPEQRKSLSIGRPTPFVSASFNERLLFEKRGPQGFRLGLGALMWNSSLAELIAGYFPLSSRRQHLCA